MAVHSTILRGALQLADAAKTGDMRRHRRLPLALRGRFMRADRNEYTCALKNISVGGAAIVTQQIPEAGERVVVYLEQIGGPRRHGGANHAGWLCLCFQSDRAQAGKARGTDNVAREPR